MLRVVVTFAAWDKCQSIDLRNKKGFSRPCQQPPWPYFMSLGPKLYHIEIALGHYENWLVLESLPCFKSYMQEIFSWDSLVDTLALPENVIAGWPESLEIRRNFICIGHEALINAHFRIHSQLARDRYSYRIFEIFSMEASSSMNLFTDYLKNHHGYEYQAFLHGFDLCRRGLKSRHDLYCDMAVLAHQNKDLLAELRKLLVEISFKS
ncbi:hypothetical protein OIU77_021478 [Salix suchowensis]|uniref:glutathione transferase n=1 Tax=Salix suchowensis TaxID=1278906 RepID=A0ABQ9C9Z9_9ROSI|nr:hypothetical protein OIU77_021478 [Salix suchowensis]